MKISRSKMNNKSLSLNAIMVSVIYMLITIPYLHYVRPRGKPRVIVNASQNSFTPRAYWTIVLVLSLRFMKLIEKNSELKSSFDKFRKYEKLCEQKEIIVILSEVMFRMFYKHLKNLSYVQAIKAIKFKICNVHLYEIFVGISPWTGLHRFFGFFSTIDCSSSKML